MTDYEVLSVLAHNMNDLGALCALHQSVVNKKGYKEIASTLESKCRKLYGVNSAAKELGHISNDVHYDIVESTKQVAIECIDCIKTETAVKELVGLANETYIELIAETWSLVLNRVAKLTVRYPNIGPAVSNLYLSDMSDTCRVAIPITAVKDIKVNRIGKFATLNHKFIVFHR